MAKKRTPKKKTVEKFKDHKPPKPVRVRFGPGPKAKQSRKPEFEKALAEIKEQDQPGEGPDRKVGTRPGPAQPGPGAEELPAPSDDLARIDRQLSKAPKALAPVLKIPFSIWASVSQIEEMKLSDPEAEEWAEPIIALLEYYFPGKIPEIIWIWLMFLSATEKVVDSRVKIRYEKRRERKHSGLAPGQSEREPAAHTTRPAPKSRHNGAEPAEGYPKE